MGPRTTASARPFLRTSPACVSIRPPLAFDPEASRCLSTPPRRRFVWTDPQGSTRRRRRTRRRSCATGSTRASDARAVTAVRRALYHYSTILYFDQNNQPPQLTRRRLGHPPPPPSFHPIPLSVAAWFAGSVRSAIDFACGSQCRQASALDVLLVALLPCGYVTTHHGDPPVAFAEQPDRSAFIETAYVFSEDAALPLAHWKS